MKLFNDVFYFIPAIVVLSQLRCVTDGQTDRTDRQMDGQLAAVVPTLNALRILAVGLKIISFSV